MGDALQNQLRVSQLEILSNSLRIMQQDSRFTDLEIIIGDRHFPVHRNILHAGSNYFRAMFDSGMKDAASSEVHLQELDASDFAIVLDFIYTGNTTVVKDMDPQQLKSVLFTAHFLQVNLLSQFCWQKVDIKLSVDCFAEFWNMAQIHQNEDLLQRIPEFVAENFMEASNSRDFLQSPFPLMLQILQHPQLVSLPDSELQAVFNWVREEPESRSKHLQELLTCLDLSLISNAYLVEVLELEPLAASEELRPVFREVSNHRLLQSETSVPCGNRLLFFAGNDNKLAYVIAFNFHFKTWSAKKLLPFPLIHGTAVVECDGSIYFVGSGQVPCEATKRAYKYFPNNNTVALIAETLTAVWQAGAAGLQGQVYVVGGRNRDGILDVVQCYDPVTDIWEHRAPTTKSHNSPEIVQLKDMLFLVGSCDCTDVECYNPVIDQWTLVTQIPGAKLEGWPIAAVCHEKIFVKKNKPEKILYVYDVSTNTWDEQKWTVEPTEIYGMWSTCKTKTKTTMPFIYVSDNFSQLYAFFPAKSKWEYLTKIKISLFCFWHTVAVI